MKTNDDRCSADSPTQSDFKKKTTKSSLVMEMKHKPPRHPRQSEGPIVDESVSQLRHYLNVSKISKAES